MKNKLMRTLKMVLLSSLLTTACAPGGSDEMQGSGLFSINVSNRRPLPEVGGFLHAGQYARSHDYYGYASQRLKPGMVVMFSASYGSGGGEAGQSHGVLVEGASGGLFYRQEDNATGQLMLPPGLPFGNSSRGVSLWELTSYLELINRVVFAETHGQYVDASGEVYATIDAYQVDFDGGTAGRGVSYRDAMEVTLKKDNRSSESNVKAYFAKGLGAVALEFRETGLVGGTFKIYIGEGNG